MCKLLFYLDMLQCGRNFKAGSSNTTKKNLTIDFLTKKTKKLLKYIIIIIVKETVQIL